MARNLAPFLKMRHLSLILALVENRTMHLAASRLNMTQSTASKMLREIEDLFGAPLFEREPRGMRPTGLGEFAARFSRNTLGRLERFSETLDEIKQGKAGTLVVGAIMGAAPELVAWVIADMKNTHPFLTVRLLGETSDSILEMLETGDVDVAIGRFSEARQQELFHFEPLAQEPLALVARPGHPLSQTDTPYDLVSLIDWPWIMQPRTNPTRSALEEMFLAAHAGSPRNQVESFSLFAILHLLQSTDGLALLPVSVVSDHLRSGLLARLQVKSLPHIPDFGILSRRDEPLTEQAAEFCRCLRERVHAVDSTPD